MSGAAFRKARQLDMLKNMVLASLQHVRCSTQGPLIPTTVSLLHPSHARSGREGRLACTPRSGTFPAHSKTKADYGLLMLPIIARGGQTRCCTVIFCRASVQLTDIPMALMAMVILSILRCEIERAQVNAVYRVLRHLSCLAV